MHSACGLGPCIQDRKSVNNVYVLLSSKEQLMNYKNLDCYEKLAIVDWFGGSGEGFF